MYTLDKVLSSYENAINEIREIYEVMKQLCDEAKSKGRIIIVESKENNKSYDVFIGYDGINIRFTIEFNEIFAKVKNFYRYYPDELKTLDTKDKIICIIEERAKEAVYNSVSVID